MTDLTYYQRNKNMIINTGKNYYENDKKRLGEQALDKYRNLSEEDKNKKREYERNRYHNMSEKKKNKKQKDIKKITARLRSLNLIINIFYGYNNVCYDLVMHY